MEEKKNSISIVILNYESYRETEKSVESILKRNLDVDGIVIVDNASVNNSFPYLKNKYQNNSRIKVVRSKRNLGFAKGNNLGIKVARKTWKTDFVLLLNSDTLMLEDDYLIKVLNEYESGIGVMQSSALRLNGRYTQKNYGEYSLQELFYDELKRFCAYYHIYLVNKKKSEGDRLGPWVSGCDIMLTPDFFKIFNGLYPLTFLYGEEHILATMLKKAGLRWEIVEDAHILHAESKSTPADFKEGTLKKQKMMLIAGRNKIIARILPLDILRRIINRGKW